MSESKGLNDGNEPEAVAEEEISEELVVLDRTGRLQLPKEYMEALEMKGGSKVKADLDLEAKRIYIHKAD